ncbi:hypothetical protein HDU67_004223 [Dinochytrium kinnereticum]|nr:hypothetical protein HDU67_004223 [Dinochytrium kinnereticum]
MSWDPHAYLANASFVPELSSQVILLLNPQPGERILDIGCGEGSLTSRFAHRKEAGGFGCSNVVGIDSSVEMIECATETYKDSEANLKFFARDAQDLETFKEFEASFDAVFSNAALHWMKNDPQAVIKGARSSLRKGGRFVGEMGGALNIATVHSAILAAAKRRGLDAVSPWFFPTCEEYQDLLEANGFTNVRMELIPRPTLLPKGLRSWLDTLSNPFFGQFPPEVQDSIKTEVCNDLEPVLRDSRGVWRLDYVRLRFHATAA